MNPLDFVNIGMKILERVLPNPEAKAAAQLELLKLGQQGEFKALDAELQIALAQIDVNKTEAGLPGWYKGGWRPLVGYICAFGLAYQFLGQPLLSWLSGIKHWAAPPQLDLGTLVTLLGGMLGLGTMRSIEKLNEKS